MAGWWRLGWCLEVDQDLGSFMMELDDWFWSGGFCEEVMMGKELADDGVGGMRQFF